MNFLDKEARKFLREDFEFVTGKKPQFFRVGRMTFLFWFTGPNRGFMVWAICAEDEPKDTRKRGELAALRRWENGGALPFAGCPECVAESVFYGMEF